MRLGKPVLKKQKRTAAGLPHNQIFHPVVVEITRHRRPSIALTVRAAESGDFKKVFPARVEKNPIAFIAAETPSPRNNQPRAFHPPILQPFIRSFGGGTNRHSIKRL